jgi:xanthine dehydrogenase YagS FAD-binding subunit
MIPGFNYVRADSRREALERLGDDGSRVHAGGTDLLGCLRDRVFTAGTVVSISALDELRGIEQTTDGGLRIGALTTIAGIAASPLVGELYPGLAQAAGSVASPQLRNQGTLGGNLCQRPRCWYYRGDFDCARKGGGLCYAADGENRYHAIFGGDPCHIVHPSDTAPMLIALGASVGIAGRRGERTVPLEEFFVLPADDLYRETVLADGELVTEVVIPPPIGTSSYRKIRERGAWDFALTSVALAVKLDARRVEAARVVLGGVAPKPWRSREAERAIVGQEITEETAKGVGRAATQTAEPLEQNTYKVRLVQGAVEASLLDLVM